jgi:hypothetical protein
MNLLMILYIVALFFVLTPGILLTLPKGGSKCTVAFVHAIVFAVIFHLTAKTVSQMIMKAEGFQNIQEVAKRITENDKGA